MSFLFLFWGWIKRALSWAAENSTHMLVVATLAAAGWGYWGWHEKAKWQKVARSAMVAQAAAARAQTTVNHAPAEKSAAIARKSDEETPAYYTAVSHAANLHAIRVWRPAGPSSPADLPRADPVVEGVHGPDPAAELVCRPPHEDTQLVNAAGRAAEMHQEALDLIAEGAAVPAD